MQGVEEMLAQTINVAVQLKLIEPQELKGEQVDRLHAVLCAAGYNIRWLLRMIASKGVAFLWQLYLRLCQLAAVSPTWLKALRTSSMSASRTPPTAFVA